MFVEIGDAEFEVLGCDDFPFLEQLQREIAGAYDFGAIAWEPGDTVVDVGAHVGLVSIYLAKTYGVRCYAYEPVPENFASLVKNVGANQAEVIPFNEAVTADGRDLTIYEGTHSGEHGAFIDSPVRGSYEATSTTLQAIFKDNNIKRCRLLKLDCEGAEHEIVANLGALHKRIDNVRGEIHLNKPLRDMGYSVEGTRDAFGPKSSWQVCEVT